MNVATTFLAVVIFSVPAIGATIYVPDDHGMIQWAIDAAADGDTIIVRPGTFFENIDYYGKAITVRSEKGAAVTTIDGKQSGSVVTFISGEGPDSILDGFTIFNGRNLGGGIRCMGSSPTIRNNTIRANFGTGYSWGGGGISCWSSSPLIEKNSIMGNRTTEYDGIGGGIDCKAFSSPTIIGNTIKGNRADEGGGIACTDYSSPIIAANRIEGNEATSSHGGGIFLAHRCEPLIANNMIVGNTAPYGAGITVSEYCSVTIANTTIADNSGARSVGAILVWGHCTVTVVNSIVWTNDDDDGIEISLYDNAPPYTTLWISHSDLEEGLASIHVETGCTVNWGAGMIDSDPRFADTGAGDYHITALSACRNAGDDSAVVDAEDFEGDPRCFDTVDMGADEFYYHLYHVGVVRPGWAIEIKVVGYSNPPAPVTLAFGNDLADPPIPTMHGDLYLAWRPIWYGFIGRIPQSGILSLAATVPSGWSLGDQHLFQALVGPWGGQPTRLTNLMALTVE